MINVKNYDWAKWFMTAIPTPGRRRQENWVQIWELLGSMRLSLSSPHPFPSPKQRKGLRVDFVLSSQKLLLEAECNYLRQRTYNSIPWYAELKMRPLYHTPYLMAQGCLRNSIYMIWEGCGTQTLMMAITEWIRPAGTQTCQNHSSDKGRAHEAPPLFEDPRATDCCWEWSS